MRTAVKVIAGLAVSGLLFAAVGAAGGIDGLLVLRPVRADTVIPVADLNVSDALPEVRIIDITPPIVSDFAGEEKAARYPLSESERDVVERVVMAESQGESYEGMMAVAQCILAAAEASGTPPSEAVVAYKYTRARPEPSDQVRQAVSAVFDLGEVVTDEGMMYFYAPALTVSEWHEDQTFVVEIGGHRFFR